MTGRCAGAKGDNGVRDIRERERLDHHDVIQLNFVRDTGTYVYRRHFRSGLRSHILEVLRPEDLEVEKRGTMKNGVKWFPKAKALKMLRIFRTRFSTLAEAREELERVGIIESYLGPRGHARSEEFLVDYRDRGIRGIVLCGLQEYVEGEVINPWRPLDDVHLKRLYARMASCLREEYEGGTETWLDTLLRNTEDFVSRIKRMITEAGHIPDLAGVGNLIITPAGEMRLVDINNISRVSRDGEIVLDDKGYPVCDKSIEALFMLESKMLGRNTRDRDPIYAEFLSPERMEKVRAAEKRFHSRLASSYDSASG